MVASGCCDKSNSSFRCYALKPERVTPALQPLCVGTDVNQGLRRRGTAMSRMEYSRHNFVPGAVGWEQRENGLSRAIQADDRATGRRSRREPAKTIEQEIASALLSKVNGWLRERGHSTSDLRSANDLGACRAILAQEIADRAGLPGPLQSQAKDVVTELELQVRQDRAQDDADAREESELRRQEAWERSFDLDLPNG